MPITTKTIRAITIWQPYASLIMCGLKRFETRSWPTKYRGALVIHAAKKWDREREEDFASIRELLNTMPSFEMTSEQQSLAFQVPMNETLGCALGVVNLKSCKQMNDGGSFLENSLGGFGLGRYGWECDFPHLFSKPIPATGKQGLWSPSAELETECRKLLRWE